MPLLSEAHYTQLAALQQLRQLKACTQPRTLPADWQPVLSTRLRRLVLHGDFRTGDADGLALLGNLKSLELQGHGMHAWGVDVLHLPAQLMELMFCNVSLVGPAAVVGYDSISYCSPKLPSLRSLKLYRCKVHHMVALSGGY